MINNNFRKKHVRIRLLTQRTTPIFGGTINFANITFDTGRTLGGTVS